MTKIEKIIEMGGTEWSKGNINRVYLNDAANTMIGLKVAKYNTGNIKSASLNGEKISNSKAGKIIASLNGSYYDVNADKFVGISEDITMNIEDDVEIVEEKDIALMTQAELNDVAAVIGYDNGNTFEEEAKYWASQGKTETSEKFLRMAARWWELEQ